MKESCKPSKMTAKQLSKKRITKSNLMKIPINEGNFSSNENENPQFINNIKKNTYKEHDREIKENIFPNPFDIPDRMRLFSKSKGQRKVKPDPFIMSEPHTICDVDNTFYKIIEGRPVRQFNDVKVYIRNIRDITLFKANTAYLDDQTLQFDITHTFEMEQHSQANNLYDKTKMNFVHFAKESYEIAKVTQSAAEVKALEVDKITEQLEVFSSRYVKLRNQLYRILSTFETLFRYGKFLNSLSPQCWRAEFDFLSFKRSSIRSSPSSRPSDVTATFVASPSECKTSMARFKEMLPYLYFKKPKQLLRLFDDLSRQCLNYMKIEVFTANIVNSVQKSRDFLKNIVKTDIEELEDIIELYERNLKFMEQKERHYRDVFEKLLFTEFQTLYASQETTKLFTCLRCVNTRIFGGSEDPKDSLTALMHGLEMQYIELTSGLDSLDFETVKAATSQMFTADIKLMKRAYIAQRTLKECEILKKALYTSFEPPRQRKIVKTAALDSEKAESIKKRFPY